MERIHISYLMISLLIVLGLLVSGVLFADYRTGARSKRDRATRLRKEQRTSTDREKSFRDKYGL
jgi:cbb3-type cytochrome oxidase subunit 3